MNQSYELHAFAGDEDGVIADNPEVETVSLRDVNAARSRAGRLAKRIRGPVDLAYSGKQPWDERYITDLAVHAYTKAVQALVDTCNLSSQPMIAMNAYLMAIQMTKRTVDTTLAVSLDTGLTKQVPVNIEMNGGNE